MTSGAPASEVIQAFHEEHHGPSERDLLFISRLRAAGLTEEQVASVIKAMDDTCRHCYDWDSGCQCANDE